MWRLTRLQSRLNESTALEHAKLYGETIAEFRTLYTTEVVETVRKQGIAVTHDYKHRAGAIPLPATLSMLLGMRIGDHESGAQTRLYSGYPFPWRRDVNQSLFQDSFARDAWEHWQKNPGSDEPFYRFEEFDGRLSLRYAVADRMRPACVNCHNSHPDTPKDDWRANDVRGVLEIITPMDSIIAHTRAGLRDTFLLMGAMAALAAVGLALVIGRFRRTAGVLETQVDERTAEIRQTRDQLKERADLLEKRAHQLEVAYAEREQAQEERKNLEGKLQQAQKLESLGVLAGGIAHDFNNLLTAVLGNAELALMELSPEAPARAEIQQISTAARRAAQLTRQMLAYSGRGKFLVEALDLSKLVEEMAHLLQVSISKNVVLKYNFAENLPAIEADASQIRQVVMNLIINASEAIGEKSGVVTVSTGVIQAERSYLSETYLDENLPEGYYVSLEVADTGCGMDEQTQQKIFDPFFTTKFTGRGLGLAAVLGIVRGHGGALKIDSQPQRGSTFKVLFPASRQPVEESVGPSATEQEWRGSGVILAVDDEETIRIAAKKILERQGFTVLTAEDGLEALEIFRSRADEIVAVLLDLTMPRLDGEETLRELRRIRPEVRVILSSGYDEEETANRFAGKGLAGFVQKPYGIRPLVEKIRQALEAPPESDRA